MSKLFYQKLAATNLKNNSRTYIPYLITCVCTVLMFYNVCTLAFHEKTGNGSLRMIMMTGMIITAIFAAIFLFYTNSFLVKRRKKEFGIFNILGLDKKHIGIVMFWENTYVTMISLVGGFMTGLLFNKLITMLLYKITRLNEYYNFEVNTKAVITTLVLFACIFALILLNNLRHIYISNPVELLTGGNVGEKEPKTKWILAAAGVLTLGSGYAMALSIKTPLSAVGAFLIAVILVMAGTYCLFSAGSIALLKLLRKNKDYYYQTKHFTAVSGMIYRMKQNAVGLANICILSTAVLVMVSTTVSMFIGLDDMISNRYFTDVRVTASYTDPAGFDKDEVKEKVLGVVGKQGRTVGDLAEYKYLEFTAALEDGEYITNTHNYSNSKTTVIVMITADEYFKFSGDKVQLAKNEVLLCSEDEQPQGSFEFMDREYKIKNTIKSYPKLSNFAAWLVDMNCYVVADDSVIDEFYEGQKKAYEDNKSDYSYEIRFNIDGTDEEKINCEVALTNSAKKLDVDAKQLSEEEFYLMYGSLFFLGIFLGFLFLMATVLIIYYKQVIEGIEDRERFRIMQNVGMSNKEVRSSVHSQVLTVFFIPIAMAIVHICVAFPILTKLLALLNLTNVPLFAVCLAVTVVCFIAVYAAVYAITARVYYKIVDNK